MTIKATLFLKQIKPSEKETYGLKSKWEPDRLPELREFENSILDMVQNIEFKNTSKTQVNFKEK